MYVLTLANFSYINITTPYYLVFLSLIIIIIPKMELLNYWIAVWISSSSSKVKTESDKNMDSGTMTSHSHHCFFVFFFCFFLFFGNGGRYSTNNFLMSLEHMGEHGNSQTFVVVFVMHSIILLNASFLYNSIILILKFCNQHH